MNTRPSAIAGYFYPDDAAKLQDQICKLLAYYADTASLPIAQAPAAIIVPHAGLSYSGDVAAAAFALLTKLKIRRVILLGPSHRVALNGCALPGFDAFQTPLGDIAVDKSSCEALSLHRLAQVNKGAHVQEHSLEIHLPFLQLCLGEFSILPLVVGQSTPTQVTNILQSCDAGDSDLILISTDLSHFNTYQGAQKRDRISINRILSLEPSLSPQDACGCYSLNGFLHWLRLRSKSDNRPQLKLMKYANSGDYGGDKEQVVGYASFALC